MTTVSPATITELHNALEALEAHNIHVTAIELSEGGGYQLIIDPEDRVTPEGIGGGTIKSLNEE